MRNLVDDELKPSRDILVVVLGSGVDAIELENKVASFLIDQGIKLLVPREMKQIWFM